MKHFFHLVPVAKEQDAAVVTNGAVNRGNDGVDDCSFVRVGEAASLGCTTAVKSIRLVNDEDFPNSCGQDSISLLL